MSFYGNVENPFKDALAYLLRLDPKELPDFLDGTIGSNQLGDADYQALQACVLDRVLKIEWFTAISIIEAADLLVSGAIENDNISCP